jgi:hypothetical protein
VEVGGELLADPTESRSGEPLERLLTIVMDRFRIGRTDPDVRGDLAPVTDVRVGRRTDGEQVQAAGAEDAPHLPCDLIDLDLREQHVEAVGVDRIDGGARGGLQGHEHVGFFELEVGRVPLLQPTAGDRHGGVVDRPYVRDVSGEEPGVPPRARPEVEEELGSGEDTDTLRRPTREVGRRTEEAIRIAFVVPLGDGAAVGGGDGA